MVSDQREDGDQADRETVWKLPGSSRKPIPDLVADRVLELVEAGEVSPGERLPTEPELARRFEVARSSVRSGLQRLQSQGVVAVERGRGWFVSRAPSRSAADLMAQRMAARDFETRDVMEVRIALEGAAAALAATRASQGQLDDILKLSKAHGEADHDDIASLISTDEEFHEAIVDASGNEYLRALYDMVTPLVADWRAHSYTSASVHDKSASDHSQIAVQLRRHDEVGARLAMTAHLVPLYRDISRHHGSEVEGARAPALSTFVDVGDVPIYESESRSTGS